MRSVGGAGFPIANTDFSRRYIAEITEGLVPELQRRGLARTRGKGATFRERLLSH
ncbi:hypothetical protein [Bosea sp. Root381]|uniref:hypothetical protein n=1 Tax=Bosea sp. Root381 TaxID=1736524 RepID=UPI0012E3952E|nr:hypothetical protein [Bosea sp. Root381]